MKICIDCNLSDIEFVKDRNICKPCQKIKNKTYNVLNKEKRKECKKKYYENNKEKTFKNFKEYKKNNYIYFIVKTSKTKDKLKNMNNDLSVEFIEFLKKKQNNKCFYCNTIMTLFNELSSLSIDRLKNNIGHIKGNIILSCRFCNYSKNCMSSTMLKIFLSMLKGNKYHLIEDNTDNWIRNIISRLSNLKKTKDIEIEINKQWIDNQYKIQKEKCYYTGIKMIPSNEKYYMFQPSLERIDSNKGYTKNNTVLVCLCVNFGKNNYTLLDYTKYLKTLCDNNHLPIFTKIEKLVQNQK